MNKRVIFNAHDFGISDEVNQRIQLAFLQGSHTSASIMSCGAAFETAVEISRELPNLSFGLHLIIIGTST
jgi:predicted glycoside hydrolase/deacetylase ChbG (UPF0249 family)